MTKTEAKILDQVTTGPITLTGKREITAGQKLQAKGLVFLNNSRDFFGTSMMDCFESGSDPNGLRALNVAREDIAFLARLCSVDKK